MTLCSLDLVLPTPQFSYSTSLLSIRLFHKSQTLKQKSLFRKLQCLVTFHKQEKSMLMQMSLWCLIFSVDESTRCKKRNKRRRSTSMRLRLLLRRGKTLRDTAPDHERCRRHQQQRRKMVEDNDRFYFFLIYSGVSMSTIILTYLNHWLYLTYHIAQYYYLAPAKLSSSFTR